MIKRILSILKRFIIAGLLLYTYNSIGISSYAFVPINFINLLFLTFFGVSALFYLILFSFFI